MMDRIDELWAALNEEREKTEKLQKDVEWLKEEVNRKVDKPYER